MKATDFNKTVVLSTNDNPDYLKYLRPCQIAWNKLGWKTLTFYHGTFAPGSTALNQVIDVSGVSAKYRVETVVQCIRLFGGNFIEDGIIMTGDVDMLPVSNYWDPKTNEITVYGHDLTGFSQYPMCYIAMTANKWREIIPEKSINALLDQYSNALSDDFEKWWSVDQQIITERLGRHYVKHVHRGREIVKGTGLARGRVDRFAWEETLKSPTQKIDAHMVRPFSQEAVDQILEMIKPI